MKILITIDDNHIDRIQEIAKELKNSGLTNLKILGSLGIIEGLSNGTPKSTFSAIAGVNAVEESEVFQAPNPDEQIQ